MGGVAIKVLNRSYPRGAQYADLVRAFVPKGSRFTFYLWQADPNGWIEIDGVRHEAYVAWYRNAAPLGHETIPVSTDPGYRF